MPEQSFSEITTIPWLAKGWLAILGVPLPLPIGIIELQKKTLKIFEFKGLIGKIFWNKELAWLPANSTRPHWCPPLEINHLAGVFSRGLVVRFQNIERNGVIR
jgi:hypothetical protein